MGVERLVITPANGATGAGAVMEQDDDFRARILIAPHSFSVAGPELAYVYHARTASGDVLDASATSPSPGEVIISVLSRTGDGTAPPQTLSAVNAVLNNDAVRPLTDFVTVQSADVVPFNINADLFLYSGPDAGLIETAAASALNIYLADNRRLGRDITRAGIIAALKVPGVQNVILAAPAADLVFTPLQAGHAAAITINNAGIAE
jgi:phage-related baseplate assembly protein